MIKKFFVVLTTLLSFSILTANAEDTSKELYIKEAFAISANEITISFSNEISESILNKKD
jgi:hypothetical protein